jgi:hypothetical protein
MKTHWAEGCGRHAVGLRLHLTGRQPRALHTRPKRPADGVARSYSLGEPALRERTGAARTQNSRRRHEGIAALRGTNRWPALAAGLRGELFLCARERRTTATARRSGHGLGSPTAFCGTLSGRAARAQYGYSSSPHACRALSDEGTWGNGTNLAEFSPPKKMRLCFAIGAIHTVYNL